MSTKTRPTQAQWYELLVAWPRSVLPWQPLDSKLSWSAQASWVTPAVATVVTAPIAAEFVAAGF